jgi:hypothetical protein
VEKISESSRLHLSIGLTLALPTHLQTIREFRFGTCFADGIPRRRALMSSLKPSPRNSGSALKGSPRTANGSENIPCEQLSVRLPATVPELKDVMVFDSEGEEPLDELQGTGTGARSSFCSLTHASTFMPTSAPPTQSTRVPCEPA